MKMIALSISLLMALAIGAKSQEIEPAKQNDFANWVIESNVKTPKISVVKFYNEKSELIYQEEIKGKRLNVNRAKVKNGLNKVLALLIEKNTQITSYNLVAISLKHY